VALYVATSIPFISVVLLPSVVDSVTLVVSGFEALVAVLFASYIIWRARKVIFLRNGNLNNQVMKYKIAVVYL
jgi:hypothetical protein